MKKISLVLLTLCLILSANLSAQKPFAGTVKFETRAEGTEDVNILSNYPISETKTVMGNMEMQKIDMQGMGQLVIQNGDKSQMTVMLDLTAMGMGMYYFSKTLGAPKNKDLKYEADKTDTKTILGYNCYKVTCTIVDLEDDEETKVIYYISDDLLPGFKHVGQPGLNGYPLMTIVNIEDATNPYTVITEAKEIKADKKIKSTSFMLPSTAKPFSEAPEELQEAFQVMEDMLNEQF